MTTTMTTAAVTVPTQGNADHHAYHQWLARVQAHFNTRTQKGRLPVFTTNAEGLFAAYLDSFTDPADRQYHHCDCCRRFIEQFGGLVVLDEELQLRSVLWDVASTPAHWQPAVTVMAALVEQAHITGVWLSEDQSWGRPQTGVWHHLAVKVPKTLVFSSLVQTGFQARAEKTQDFQTVKRALEDYTLPMLEQAVRLLKSEALYRSEKVLGQAQWLHDLHVQYHRAPKSKKQRLQHPQQQARLLWQAVAQAPAGFCHPRSSMIGTLLDDLAAGMRFDEVSTRFAQKMHPLQYQRPQAAPKAGTIVAAEKLIAQLNAEGSLKRRFARLDEIQALWRDGRIKTDSKTGSGVFAHLMPKTTQKLGDAVIPPPVTITWEKFRRTVLPTAQGMALKVPSHDSFGSLVTAVHPDAPPILQWDNEKQRNPFSHYLWVDGSDAEQFGLSAHAFHPIAAVTLLPSMWHEGFAHQGQGFMLVLQGAKDTRAPSACLFPEILKSELHGVRSVIEAYSRTHTLEKHNGAHAAGLLLQASNSLSWNATVRVWSDHGPTDYCLDRWD
ncbi:MAG: hypothetical protein RLZZ612_2275 [Pseudomonadota bacterium]|jgi:hypothetical protein